MIVRATVSKGHDPSGRGRIKASIPNIAGAEASDWIWPCTSAGYFVEPKPGDMVWVLFENGDLSTPVWIGTAKDDSDYRTLLQDVQDLKEAVEDLQNRVSALEA